MKLIDRATGEVLKPGDRVVTVAGQIGDLIRVDPPAHEGQAGAIWFRPLGAGYVGSYLPMVINARFVDGSEGL
jgi:hypothetical protein